MTRTMKYTVALKENRREQNELEASSALECITFLVNIVSEAGEDLDAYIQTHSEVPNVEVLERVSSILKHHGFFPNGEGIDVRNLCPFDCKMYVTSGKQGHLLHIGLMMYCDISFAGAFTFFFKRTLC